MEWRAVPLFPKYEACSDGRVRNAATLHVMRPATSHKGYLAYGLMRDRKLRSARGHKLVWLAFRGAIPTGMQINHKNGVKNDNRLENLEVVSASENCKHAYRTGLASNLGVRHPRAKFTDDDIRAIRKARAEGVLLTALATQYGVSFSNISMISRGETWKHVI